MQSSSESNRLVLIIDMVCTCYTGHAAVCVLSLARTKAETKWEQFILTANYSLFHSLQTNLSLSGFNKCFLLLFSRLNYHFWADRKDQKQIISAYFVSMYVHTFEFVNKMILLNFMNVMQTELKHEKRRKKKYFVNKMECSILPLARRRTKKKKTNRQK